MAASNELAGPAARLATKSAVLAGVPILRLSRRRSQARGHERQIEIVEQRAVIEKMRPLHAQAVAGNLAGQPYFVSSSSSTRSLVPARATVGSRAAGAHRRTDRARSHATRECHEPPAGGRSSSTTAYIRHPGPATIAAPPLERRKIGMPRRHTPPRPLPRRRATIGPPPRSAAAIPTIRRYSLVRPRGFRLVQQGFVEGEIGSAGVSSVSISRRMASFSHTGPGRRKPNRHPRRRFASG